MRRRAPLMARQPEPGTASAAYYAALAAYWAAQGRPLARWCAALAERLLGRRQPNQQAGPMLLKNGRVSWSL